MIRTVRTPNEQVPGIYRRRVGDIVITTLNDGYLEAGLEVLLNIPTEEAQELLQRAGRPARARSAINAFAVHAGGRVGLIDTGSGATLGPTAGRLPTSLTAAGIDPNEIDTVLLTHLHPDHSNGLTDPSGAPLFPNAELRMHEAEAAFWQNYAAFKRATEPNRSYFQTARAQIGPYRNRLRLFQQGEVFPGVSAVPMAGHTPGHSGYLVASGDAALMIWGDIVSIPEVQIPRPEAGFIFDVDPTAASATRRRVLDMVATDHLLVGGMHVQFPGFARIARDGANYQLVPEV